MSFAYFIDELTDRTPEEVPKNVVLIGQISKQQRKKWRNKGRILGMSCGLKGQSAGTGFDLWPYIKDTIPETIKNEKKVANKILDSTLIYPDEFQTEKESIPSKKKGHTIWMQDFEFTPNKAKTNDVYAGITALLWAGRTLLGDRASIIPVPASSIFKNLGNPDLDKVFKKPNYLKALELKNLGKTNPEQASNGQWNFLSVLKHNNLIDGFLGQQYSENNSDALPGSISKDTRDFDPSTPLPYAILSNVEQLRNTNIGKTPWSSYFDGEMPFKSGVYFADGISPQRKDFKADEYLKPTRQPISNSALAQIFYTSDPYRAIDMETRDLRQHPVLGGISSTRLGAYETFVSNNPELKDHLSSRPANERVTQLVSQFNGQSQSDSAAQQGIDVIEANRAQLNQSGTLAGHNGKDVLIGSQDDDLLIGHGGKDRLNGSGGNDWLFGGDGADRFIIPKTKTRATKDSICTLPDFDGQNGDRIQIKGIKQFNHSNPSKQDNKRTHAYVITSNNNESGLKISIDDNSDKEADRTIILPGVNQFNENWII